VPGLTRQTGPGGGSSGRHPAGSSTSPVYAGPPAVAGLAALSSSVLIGIALAFAVGVAVVVLGAGYRGRRSH
jgi:hypothetical protein